MQMHLSMCDDLAAKQNNAAAVVPHSLSSGFAALYHKFLQCITIRFGATAVDIQEIEFFHPRIDRVCKTYF